VGPFIGERVTQGGMHELLDGVRHFFFGCGRGGEGIIYRCTTVIGVQSCICGFVHDEDIRCAESMVEHIKTDYSGCAQ